jgi:hypothetical protein
MRKCQAGNEQGIYRCSDGKRHSGGGECGKEQDIQRRSGRESAARDVNNDSGTDRNNPKMRGMKADKERVGGPVGVCGVVIADKTSCRKSVYGFIMATRV